MQLKAMTDTTTPKQEEGEVNAISKGNGPGNQSYQKYTGGRGNKRHDNNPRQCYRCGDTSHTKGQQCPAIGVECFNCNKQGHFSKVSQSKTRSDVFQKHLDSSLESLKGVTGIADDTFVYGATEEEHDANMVNLMIKSRERGITFNKDKVQFKCQEVSFFGHKWTRHGIKPDDSKISAIQKMTSPENHRDPQSFLGLVNYLKILRAIG